MSDQSDEYWSDADDPYRDKSTGILKNIPNLTTQEQLDTFEAMIFQVNFPEALSLACHADMNMDLWKRIHLICFKDIYPWAGNIRTIRISKGATVFAYPENIEREADKIFQDYKDLFALGRLTLAEIARLTGELNVIHPFREGNGRTLRILLEAMCNAIKYDIDYELTTQDEQIDAFIKSYRGNNSALEKLLIKITRLSLRS